jgi:protein-tyrosine-phosphatase
MEYKQPVILIVGGANTGRSAMAEAMLRRLVSEQGFAWVVESAGVIGHDDEPAELEACQAMSTFGLDMYGHRARSVNADLIESATLLISVDSGTANVIKQLYPDAVARTISLGTLSGTQRDIPDLFHMDIGSWVTYAREIYALLTRSMDTLIDMVQGEALSEAPAEAISPEPPQASPDTEAAQVVSATVPPDAMPDTAVNADVAADTSDVDPHLAADRSAPVEQCEHLLAVLRDMPDLVEWSQARQQLTDHITAAGAISLSSHDLAQAYTAMLLALLALHTAMPSREQLALLSSAIKRLHAPVDQPAMSELTALVGRWNQA